MIRRSLFRVLVGILLLVMPFLIPGIFLLLKIPFTMENIRELYRDFWDMLVRGFA